MKKFKFDVGSLSGPDALTKDQLKKVIGGVLSGGTSRYHYSDGGMMWYSDCMSKSSEQTGANNAAQYWPDAHWCCDSCTSIGLHFNLQKNIAIRILPVSYFIACKLEALFNRGLTDLRLSKDLEDIVFLLNNNVTLSENNPDLLKYIRAQVSILLGKRELREAIFCVLHFGENDPEYVNHVMAELNKLS